MLGRSKVLLSFFLFIILVSAGYFFWQQKNTPPSEDPEVASPQEERVFIDIDSQNDCSNDCEKYRSDQEKYNYCRAVCGFTVEEGVTSLPTSTNPELSEDYKTKEAAVSEKNIEKCNDIKDSNIKKTCQARVTEDIFEQQGGNGF